MSCFSWCDSERYSEPDSVPKNLFTNTIFPFLNSESVHPSIQIYCLICKERVENVVIYCNFCKVSLGHKDCVKTWLIRRNTCPSCNQILEL